jgi:hypothetical protein
MGCSVVDRPGERPEVQRQEKRERDARDAVHHGHPVGGFELHAKTEWTARIPIAKIATQKASMARSRDGPRQRSHSPQTVLSPIGACTAAATTNSV